MFPVTPATATLLFAAERQHDKMRTAEQYRLARSARAHGGGPGAAGSHSHRASGLRRRTKVAVAVTSLVAVGFGSFVAASGSDSTPSQQGFHSMYTN